MIDHEHVHDLGAGLQPQTQGVGELFEARKPKDPAVISEIDGIVKDGGVVKGQPLVPFCGGLGSDVRIGRNSSGPVRTGVSGGW